MSAIRTCRAVKGPERRKIIVEGGFALLLFDAEGSPLPDLQLVDITHSFWGPEPECVCLTTGAEGRRMLLGEWLQ